LATYKKQAELVTEQKKELAEKPILAEERRMLLKGVAECLAVLTKKQGGEEAWGVVNTVFDMEHVPVQWLHEWRSAIERIDEKENGCHVDQQPDIQEDTS
jgi:hypothetical protein